MYEIKIQKYTMTLQSAIPQTGNMVLKPEILERINTVGHRTKLALIMDVGDQTISNYIKRNDPQLTQYAPLEYIRQIMGCIEAGELLEPKKEL